MAAAKVGLEAAVEAAAAIRAEILEELVGLEVVVEGSADMVATAVAEAA